MIISPSRGPQGVGREGEKNERLVKLITREMGVQISYRLGTKISKKGVVWQGSAENWGDYPRTV